MIHGLLRAPELAGIPANPPSGQTKLFFTSTGQLIGIDQSGAQDIIYPQQGALVVDFLTSGTGSWVKPPGTTHMEVFAVGGGAGGSAGGQNPGAATAAGGGGGGCAAINHQSYAASIFAASVPYTVGTGGLGAIQAAAPGTVAGGVSGASGTSTFFGQATSIGATTDLIMIAQKGGNQTGNSYFTALYSIFFNSYDLGIGSVGGDGGNPAAGEPGVYPGSHSGYDYYPYPVTGGGGGGGGAINSAGVTFNGGAGGITWAMGDGLVDAPVGGSGGGDGANGYSVAMVGAGGGGGAANTTLKGGKGGDGALFGGGGGGGGASRYQGGNGGNGGSGVLIILARR